MRAFSAGGPMSGLAGRTCLLVHAARVSTNACGHHDDALVRTDASDILEDTGFRVLEAATLDQAISIVEQRATAYNSFYRRADAAEQARRLISPKNVQRPVRNLGS